MKCFGDVFQDCTKYATKIKTSEYKGSGKYAIVDQGQCDISGYTDLEDGLYKDVPAIIFGDHTRVIKYIDKPFFLGADGVKLLKSKLPNPNYKYLYYALKSVRIPNTGYNRHFKWLKEAKFNFPDNTQQEKIVSILDNIQKVIKTREKQLEQLDLLIKSRFFEMFGDLFCNDKGYTVVNLSDIAKYWNGLTYKPDNVQTEGIIVLRSSNIQNFHLDFNDLVRVNCHIKDKQYVKENDILMCSRNGSAKLVGKVALIKDLKEPMSFGAFMMVVRSRYYSYLMTYFQTDVFKRQITTGATTTINQITVNMLNKIKLPLPPIEQQNKFAEFVEQVEKTKTQVQKSLDEAQLLFDSLMQEYFG